jgi:hypothetical protein
MVDGDHSDLTQSSQSQSGLDEMSADNGIYVLQTYGPEFRVAYAHAIDNIFGTFSDETLHWTGNVEMMRRYFGESKVYDNLEEALDIAQTLSYDYDYLEDGVCVIREFESIKFNE